MHNILSKNLLKQKPLTKLTNHYIQYPTTNIIKKIPKDSSIYNSYLKYYGRHFDNVVVTGFGFEAELKNCGDYIQESFNYDTEKEYSNINIDIFFKNFKHSKHKITLNNNGSITILDRYHIKSLESRACSFYYGINPTHYEDEYCIKDTRVVGDYFIIKVTYFQNSITFESYYKVFDKLEKKKKEKEAKKKLKKLAKQK